MDKLTGNPALDMVREAAKEQAHIAFDAAFGEAIDRGETEEGAALIAEREAAAMYKKILAASDSLLERAFKWEFENDSRFSARFHLDLLPEQEQEALQKARKDFLQERWPEA